MRVVLAVLPRHSPINIGRIMDRSCIYGSAVFIYNIVIYNYSGIIIG